MNVDPIGALARAAAMVALLPALAGCMAIGQYSNASFNEPIASAGAASAASRATLEIDGQRGNQRVLMLLSLSGGGSRSAYMAAATMHALESLGLLQEVDAISAVSGGSLAAAYYVASRDAVIDSAPLAARLLEMGAARPPQFVLDPPHIRCSSALGADQAAGVRALAGDPLDGERLVELCRAREFPRWERDTTLDTMKKNFIVRWLGNLLWPPNLGRYWFSSFDRSDIMVDTLAGAALHRSAPGLLPKDDLRMRDLNPLRPYLMIGATNATRQAETDGRVAEFPFGSGFTFTREDFQGRLCSDIGAFSLPRAVMTSSAFPLAFATMTLEDFGRDAGHCAPREPGLHRDRRFLHLIDGGNADNLGLRAVKRALLELWSRGQLARYDRIIVLQVDAFATPEGTGPHKPDPRNLIDMVLDTNVSHAVDALLQSNRDRLLDDFDNAELHFERECEVTRNAVRHFGRSLCERLERTRESWPHVQRRAVPLDDKLVFFHFGFADVVRSATDRIGQDLKAQLDQIPTSLSIDDSAQQLVQSHADDGYEFVRRESSTGLIERAVSRVINREHPCIAELIALVKDDPARDTPSRVRQAHQTCLQEDRRR